MKDVLCDEWVYAPEDAAVWGENANSAWWYTVGGHTFNYPVDGDKILSNHTSYAAVTSDDSTI